MSDTDPGGTGGTWRDSDLGAGGTGGTWRDSDLGPGGTGGTWRDSASGPGGTGGTWRESGSIDPNSAVQTPGISLFYKVTLEVVDLGFWTKCSGLGMTIATDHRGDSAMSFFQHHLPGHMQYETLTLERPVSGDTATVMNWISAYHMLPV